MSKQLPHLQALRFSRRALIFGGLGSLGTGLTAVGGCQNRRAQVEDAPPQLAKPLAPAPFSNLGIYRFETVTVNGQGKLVKREQKQARYFTEQLGRKTLFGMTWQQGVTLEMIEIPAGEFLMGASANERGNQNEKPQHRVKIERFFMGRFEVTEAQWYHVTGGTAVFPKGDNFPIADDIWGGANQFCKALSKLTGRAYRLPSEAEWEYACRAGTTTPFHFGTAVTPEWVNFGNGDAPVVIPLSPDAPRPKLDGLVPVGTRPANGFGLHDMHGNADEWCADHPHEDYQGAPMDGRAWLDGKTSSNESADIIYRVARGGDCYSLPQDCRSASRKLKQGSVASAGFRVVCSG
jgi:formylglycine-generating enzyme required for sulfatase activity